MKNFESVKGLKLDKDFYYNIKNFDSNDLRIFNEYINSKLNLLYYYNKYTEFIDSKYYNKFPNEIRDLK